jgi:hypothetical protein
MSIVPRRAGPAIFMVGRAENIVITERKCGPRRQVPHQVTAEAVHQTRHIEIQPQTDVDAAHANGQVKPGYVGPVRSYTNRPNC